MKKDRGPTKLLNPYRGKMKQCRFEFSAQHLQEAQKKYAFRSKSILLWKRDYQFSWLGQLKISREYYSD